MSAAGTSHENLKLFPIELNTDDGWDEAMSDCDYLLHVASPISLDDQDEEYFVKPAKNGSSLGVSRVTNLNDLESAVNDAKKFSDQVIIEECYGDAEYTVAILNGIALEPLEILPDPKQSFYDYKAKYLSGETKKVEIIDKALAEELKAMAIKAFYSHDCNSWGRVDFVTKGESIGVLEINTVPGFTEKSLVPLAAKKSGINYQQLITEIIEDAL